MSQRKYELRSIGPSLIYNSPQYPSDMLLHGSGFPVRETLNRMEALWNSGSIVA
jgi:hypothetical protein